MGDQFLINVSEGRESAGGFGVVVFLAFTTFVFGLKSVLP